MLLKIPKGRALAHDAPRLLFTPEFGFSFHLFQGVLVKSDYHIDAPLAPTDIPCTRQRIPSKSPYCRCAWTSNSATVLEPGGSANTPSHCLCQLMHAPMQLAIESKILWHKGSAPSSLLAFPFNSENPLCYYLNMTEFRTSEVDKVLRL
jgi:hypothetical protein